MKLRKKIIKHCLSRDLNISLTYQKINNWSIEIYTGYKDSYTLVFYSDGHLKEKDAAKAALEYFSGFKKI